MAAHSLVTTCQPWISWQTVANENTSCINNYIRISNISWNYFNCI